MHGMGDFEAAAMLTEEERQQSVVITDPSLADNPIIYVSEEFEVQTGYAPEECLGRNCRFLQGPNTDPKSILAISAAIEAGTEITVDVLNYKKDGTEFWNRLRIRPLYDEEGNVRYFVGAQNPISPEEVLSRPIEAIFD